MSELIVVKNNTDDKVNIMILPEKQIVHLFFKYLDEHYSLPNEKWNSTNSMNKLKKNNYYNVFSFLDKHFYEENNFSTINTYEESIEYKRFIRVLQKSPYITSPLTEFCTEFIKNNIFLNEYCLEYLNKKINKNLKKGDLIILSENFSINTDIHEMDPPSDCDGDYIMIWDGEKACNLQKKYGFSIVPNIYMLEPTNTFTPYYWSTFIQETNFFYICTDYLQEICDSLEFDTITIDEHITEPLWKGYFTHLNVKYTVVITVLDENNNCIKDADIDFVKKNLLNDIATNFRPISHTYYLTAEEEYNIGEEYDWFCIDRDILFADIRMSEKNKVLIDETTENRYSEGYPISETSYVLK